MDDKPNFWHDSLIIQTFVFYSYNLSRRMLFVYLCNIKTASKSLVSWQISVKNRENTNELLHKVCFLCQNMEQCVIVSDAWTVNDDLYENKEYLQCIYPASLLVYSFIYKCISIASTVSCFSECIKY